MSVDFSSYAVIGFKFPGNTFMEEKTEKHQKHPIPPNAKYCPICGDSAYEKYRDDPLEKVGRFNVIMGTDHEYAYIGLSIESDDNGDNSLDLNNANTIFRLDELRIEIIDALKSVGINEMDSLAWGLHSVLYCSY